MKAIVMAGGEGSRLRPLTCDRPKPMVPVMNRPMMEYILELLAQHGITEIGVTLQYLPEQIREHFGRGDDFGVNLHYFVEDSPLGTAGSVKNAAEFLDDTFIVISGDALTDFDLTGAIDFHCREQGLATLVLTRVENPLEYGIVFADNNCRVSRFLEKPGWGEVFSDTVNTGIYILEPEVLADIPGSRKFDFSKDLFPLLLKRGEALMAYIAEGYWCDIGNLAQYRQAHIDILDGRVKVNLEEKELSGGIHIGKGAYVDPTARIYPPVVIGAGCRIGPEVKLDSYSVLGPYTELQREASVKRGITWAHAFIGRNASLHGGVICCRARLNKGSEVYENAVVGDTAVIEEQAVIKPGVKVWPEKVVESGACLSQSLVWGDRTGRSLFARGGVAGIVNRDLTPEIAARLGGAFGSLLTGKAVILACDYWPASRMVKQSVAVGLQSAGVRVMESGELLLPVLRGAVSIAGAAGGVHVHSNLQGEVVITFLDQDGLNIPRGVERKIEQFYSREDFRRVPGAEILSPGTITGITETYRKRLLSCLDLDAFYNRRFRVIIGYPNPLVESLLLPVLQGVGTDVVILHSSLTGEDFSAPDIEKTGIAEMITASSADLGLIIGPNAENLFLFDEQGRMLGDGVYTALITLLILENNGGGRVTVPVTASAAIEELAARFSAEVKRVKTSPRELMEALKGEISQSGPLNQYLLSFDAVEGILRLMEYMAHNGLPLSGLIDKLPLPVRLKKEVPVSWSVKGKIMRRLIEASNNQEREIIDGLRVKHNHGWATIIPDSERPSYYIYSEAYNEEFARSLADFYEHQLHRFEKE